VPGDGVDEQFIDTTKRELARLSDAVRIQIQGPLKQIKESDSVGIDSTQMLDSVASYKQVAMDILEQLRSPPTLPRAASAQTLPSMAEIPGSNPFRARARSTQTPHVGFANTTAGAVDDLLTANRGYSDKMLARAASTYSDKIVVGPSTRGSPSSVNSIPHDTRRESVVSANSQTGVDRLPVRLSTASISSPSANHSPRQMSVVPIVISPSVSSFNNIGSTLHHAQTTPATSSAAPARPRQTSVYGNASGALLAGSFLGPATLKPTLSSHRPSTPNASAATPPSKSNDWHGFCKGAWAIREDAKKGLATQVVPVGMYGRKEQWRCKQCAFTGEVFGTGKVKGFDNRAHLDPATRIQYKWMFLAKSHCKLKDKGVEMGPSFGCTECVDDGRRTNTYVDAKALLDHISIAHQNGVRAAERPAEPFWQGEAISPEGSWDLYVPIYDVGSPV